MLSRRALLHGLLLGGVAAALPVRGLFSPIEKRKTYFRGVSAWEDGPFCIQTSWPANDLTLAHEVIISWFDERGVIQSDSMLSILQGMVPTPS